jgi:hypothetical protein
MYPIEEFSKTFEISRSAYGVDITKEASMIVSNTAIAPWIMEARKNSLSPFIFAV